jgi:hypothetical protein
MQVLLPNQYNHQSKCNILVLPAGCCVEVLRQCVNAGVPGRQLRVGLLCKQPQQHLQRPLPAAAAAAAAAAARKGSSLGELHGTASCGFCTA